MLIVLVVLQLLLLTAVTLLWLRKPATAPVVAPDPRQLQLPEQVALLHGRHETHDSNLRSGLMDLRRETELASDAARTANARDFAALRTEVTGNIAVLGDTLRTELASFRTELAGFGKESRDAGGKLVLDVHTQHEAIGTQLRRAQAEAREQGEAAREALHARLRELTEANSGHQEKLRVTVEGRLDALNSANSAKLEEMRQTVDEKLHATLHTRLTESFGQVTDQLNKVHTGLGEMSKLSEGVDGLSRIFTNVKSRGGFAEVQLGMLLEQMLAPSQFVRNAKVKPNTGELVEFAVRFPGHGGEALLPIDAKFPREAWERLESAYAANDADQLAAAGKAFEASIRTEGKRICEKYINPPYTTPHAIMFLPTEGLYAEVMRRDALQAEIQSKCQVTIAGPSTLSAILTSFQMGFQMLVLQEKGDEVWKVLESAKKEFGNFGKLMEKVEGDVGKVQKTLSEVGVRTRAINRSLRQVSEPEETPSLAFATKVPGLQLAAAGEDDE